MDNILCICEGALRFTELLIDQTENGIKSLALNISVAHLFPRFIVELGNCESLSGQLSVMVSQGLFAGSYAEGDSDWIFAPTFSTLTAAVFITTSRDPVL